MNIPPLIAVIVVNWNGRDFLHAALASLDSDGYSNLHIIVIDNASKDGSVEMIRNEFPKTQIIVNNFNSGFSKGNNQGIEEAFRIEAKYLFFMNNDATVAPECLKNLSMAFETNERLGAAAPFILYANDPSKIWFGGGRVRLWSGQIRHTFIRREFKPGNYKPANSDYITGCALMVRSKTLRRVGGFDDRFGLYSEDVDLSLRIRRDGWKLIVTPEAIAYHNVSSSTGGGLSPLKAFYRARSTALLLRGWARWFDWLTLPVIGLFGLFAVTIGLVVKGNGVVIPALFQGLICGMTGSKIPDRFRLEFLPNPKDNNA